MAEQCRPHGEWVKVRACEDADKVSHRTGHLESTGVIMKGRRDYGQVKERVLHGSAVEIKTALASHCDPRRVRVLLFLLKPSKIGIICVTRVLGPHLGQDAVSPLQDCCLKWPSATADEEVCVSHV